jgi:hypothetical protein
MRGTQRKGKVATPRLSRASLGRRRRWMPSTCCQKSIVLLFSRERLHTYILRTIPIHLSQMHCELTTITASIPPVCKPSLPSFGCKLRINCQFWPLPHTPLDPSLAQNPAFPGEKKLCKVGISCSSHALSTLPVGLPDWFWMVRNLMFRLLRL